jgi:hypothetical protein
MTARPYLLATMTAALVTASLPAAAETPPPVVVVPATPPPGYVPAPQAYPPGYAPPPPGYYVPPPGGYYAPPATYYAQPGYGPAYAPRLTERRSTGMMIAGIVSIGVGGVFLLTGAALAAIDASCDSGFESCPGAGAGIGLAVGGGVLLLVGIPLTIVGAQRVPVGQAALTPAAPAWLGEPWLKVGDAHARTPTAAGWRWQF